MEDFYKVLIVDDFESTRVFIRYVLANAGFKTTVVSNANQALDAIDDEVFDLIITDVNLPDMDGFDFISELSTLEKLENTLIMVVSMDNSKKSRQRGESLGVTNWFSKPISPIKLVDYLKEIKLSWEKGNSAHG